MEVIKDYAFKGSIIKKIDFPKSLLSIGNYAFEECKKLKSISFKDDSLITSIGVGAFSNCLALQSFTIGKNFKVEEIKDYTFRKDLKLHDIDLSETVIKEYGKGVFYGCEALESFKFNNQVKKISSNLFSDCSSLSSVDFNDAQIEIVGEMAFSGCTSLSLISLPESVTEIEKYAFLESGLTSFNVGKNVNSIGIEAFSYTKIVEFTVDLNNNSYKAVDGVLFTKDSKELTAYPCASNLLEYVIPEDTEIIYAGAFMGASNIKKVTIGAKVNDIGDYAFASMASLTQIIVLNDTPAKLGSKTFNENDASIFVPQGSLDNYQKNWKSYKAKIKENS